MDTSGLKAALVNRLQARLDEEEFGMIDPPAADKPVDSPPPTEPAAAAAPVAAAPSPTPAPAPKAAPAPAPAAEKKEETPAATGGMSFEEKKKQRAARFGIAVVEAKKPTPKKNNPKKKGDKKADQKSDKKPKKKEQQVKHAKPAEPPLLPKAEIEKLLQRAERFGNTDTKRVAELKTMLRKHRFSK